MPLKQTNKPNQTKQNNTRKEQMSPRSTYTRMNDQRKAHIDPKKTPVNEPPQTTTDQ